MARLKFRHRIWLLLSLAAMALVAVTAVTLILGRRSSEQLAAIETRYVPLSELDRDLETTFEQIPRALGDAATAGEMAKVVEADAIAADLVHRIAAGASVIVENGADPALLTADFLRYYRSARQVAAALAGGADPGRIAMGIEGMNRERDAFRTQLGRATRPDHQRLEDRFSAAYRTQATALEIDIVVAALALGVMGILSLRIVRRTVEALHAVSRGVERLARGNFSQEIDVPPGDELGDLAREANRTAARLREYREQEQALLAEAQHQAAAAETANKELEAFSYSVSHDLRAPLRSIDGFSQALLEDQADALAPKGQDYLRRIRSAAQRMAELIDDLLRLSRITRADLRRERVDLSTLATSIVAELRRADPERKVEVSVAPGVTAPADPRLIRITLENLLGNAWKFTARNAEARIELGSRDEAEGRVYFVRDNGAGFDMKYVERLFGAFQRLHSEKDFPGTGIGLATVQRIVKRHGGRIWVDAAVGQGATFQFTLPEDLRGPPNEPAHDPPRGGQPG